MSNGYIGTSPVPRASRVIYSGKFLYSKSTIDVPGGYCVGNIHLYINGSLINPEDYTALDGKIIDLGSEFPEGTSYFIEEFRQFELTKDVSLISNTQIAENGQYNFYVPNYTPGMNAISVFKDGEKLIVNKDYTEPSTTSIRLIQSAQPGEVYEFIIVARAEIKNDSVYAANTQYDNSASRLIASTVQEAIDSLANDFTRNESRLVVTATEDQTIFNTHVYTPGTNSLTVYRDGTKLVHNYDYEESDLRATIELLYPAVAGERYEFVIDKRDPISEEFTLSANTTYDNSASGIEATNVQEALDRIVADRNATPIRTLVTATEGQTIFNCSPYQIGLNCITVYREGTKLILGVDYLEYSTTSIQMLGDVEDGEKYEFIVISRAPLDPENTALASNVGYDDSASELGVGNVQEAIDKITYDYATEEDLANSDDSTKGASLVGWDRVASITDKINTVHERLNTQPVNIWEFAHLVLTRTDPADPSTWDWSPAITEALNYINTNYNTLVVTCGTILDIPWAKSGITTDRPSGFDSTQIGYTYFDTTLGYPIYWNGTEWVDTTGSVV
jgi:hypothetical protein